MLSEGRSDSDNVVSLKEGKWPLVIYFNVTYIKKNHVIDSGFVILGVLTMYLEKETYERAGLVGKTHGVKGKRGLKPRWSKFSPIKVSSR